MLTPEQIRTVEFTKSLGGYKTSEVDVFIDQCADTVTMLLAEKADLNKKLEVLADKLVEYRNDEDSIRTALLSAQRMGDTVVREANHKASLILEDANIKAEKVLEVAKRNISSEERELERIKKEVAHFKSRMLSIYKEHLSLIDVLPDMPAEEKSEGAAEEKPAEEAAVPAEPVAEAPDAAEPADETSAEPAFEPLEAPEAETLAPAVSSGFVLNIPELDEEEAAEAAPEAEKEPVRAHVSRFGDLQFGEDFEIGDSSSKGFLKRKK